MGLLKRLWDEVRTPDDQMDCYGCFLDRQVVTSEEADHTCAKYGGRSKPVARATKG